MAYAMMGGIISGTVLTLLFLPALYLAWFRIKPGDGETANSAEKPEVLPGRGEAGTGREPIPSGQ
jgi:hypothetical protein